MSAQNYSAVEESWFPDAFVQPSIPHQFKVIINVYGIFAGEMSWNMWGFQKLWSNHTQNRMLFTVLHKISIEKKCRKKSSDNFHAIHLNQVKPYLKPISLISNKRHFIGGFPPPMFSKIPIFFIGKSGKVLKGEECIFAKFFHTPHPSRL